MSVYYRPLESRISNFEFRFFLLALLAISTFHFPLSSLRAQGVLSGRSAMLLTRIDRLDEKQVAEEYPLVFVDGEACVAAFVELAGVEGEKVFARYGVRVQSRVGGMMTVCIPLRSYAAFARSGLCSWLDVGATPLQKLDKARAELGINDIYGGVNLPHGYDGTGVVVGVIDIGFQYTHPAFRDSTGTTLRIKRVWEQGATSGTSPEGYDYGRELTTEDDILAAQADRPTAYHGTHVTGIAAGCGAPDSMSRFRGMAPAADIVLVSMASLPGIFDGIAYIRNYAASVGKPCVINMSLGMHTGPHDGTSSLDRMMDELHQQHPEGFLVVGAASNEGSQKLHLQKAFAPDDTVVQSIVDIKPNSNGYAEIDLWGSVRGSYQVALGIFDTATGTLLAQSNFFASSDTHVYGDTLAPGKTHFDIACNGTNHENGRQNIFVTLYDQPDSTDTYRVVLIVKSTSGTDVHAWSDQCYFVSGGFENMTEGNTDYTVAEIGGTARSIISVGAYTTATSWRTLDGRTGSYGVEVLGGLAFFSSHGPTLDGRTKPDITAPGQHIVSSINRYASSIVQSPYCTNFTLFEGDTAFYGAAQGTSMASPSMAGIMALWLQENPHLRYDSALVMIRSTARTDSLTGTLPATGSNLWGWGKINPFAGLGSAAGGDTTGFANADAIGFKVAVDGRRVIIAAPQGEPVRIVDVMGRTVVDQKEVTPAGYLMPAAGVYMVRVGNAPARKTVVIK